MGLIVKKIFCKVLLLITISPLFISNPINNILTQDLDTSSTLKIVIASGEKLPPILLPTSIN